MVEIEKYIVQIKEVFTRHKILFAYLFGSQVSGNIGKLSDIDIAVYFDEQVSPEERFNKKLRIMAELSEIFKKEEVDVVVLNDTYPLFEHRVVKYGKVIFSVDENKRIDYEVKAVMRYLDFKPFIEKYTKETLYGR